MCKTSRDAGVFLILGHSQPLFLIRFVSWSDFFAKALLPSASCVTLTKFAGCSICTVQLVPPTPATRFMHSYWNLRQLFVDQVSPRLREQIGLEVPEVFLLEYIGKSSLSPSEIAVQMRLPPHAISRRLDALEKRHLITRRVGAGDARRRVLSLTAKGKAVAEEASGLLDSYVSEILSVLEPATVDTLLGTLEELTQT